MYQDDPEPEPECTRQEALLRDLRATPAAGSWAVLDSMFDAGCWSVAPTRPSEWHHTRAQAEAGARERVGPTWIARVVECRIPRSAMAPEIAALVDGDLVGWTTGEEIFVPCDAWPVEPEREPLD